jgi:hypothetical protein
MGRGVASAVHVPPSCHATQSIGAPPYPPCEAPILLVFDTFVKLCQSEFVDAEFCTDRTGE